LPTPYLYIIEYECLASRYTLVRLTLPTIAGIWETIKGKLLGLC